MRSIPHPPCTAHAENLAGPMGETKETGVGANYMSPSSSAVSAFLYSSSSSSIVCASSSVCSEDASVARASHNGRLSDTESMVVARGAAAN